MTLSCARRANRAADRRQVAAGAADSMTRNDSRDRMELELGLMRCSLVTDRQPLVLDWVAFFSVSDLSLALLSFGVRRAYSSVIYKTVERKFTSGTRKRDKC